MTHDRKRTILVISHLYPRTQVPSCTMAPFLSIWARNLARNYNMIILAPRHPKALPEQDGIKIEYFGYSFKRLEKFSYTSGLLAKSRGFRIHYKILFVCYLFAYIYKSLIIVRREKPDLIHSHWFVPGGIVGHVTSLLTGIPHVVTVYSDGFFIENKPIFRWVARIIFNRAKAVIAISKSIKEYCDIVNPDTEVIYPCHRLF